MGSRWNAYDAASTPRIPNFPTIRKLESLEAGLMQPTYPNPKRTFITPPFSLPQIYKQDFFNNMKSKEKPKIDKFSGNDWTRVTFWPDFAKFGMKGFDNDTLHLLQRRVYDIAGTTDEKVKVFLNGSLIRNTRTNKPITNFEE